MQLAAASVAKSYCCADSTGNILFLSDQLQELLGYNKGELSSIFQVNPEMSFLAWKSVMNEISKSPIISDGSYITSKGKISTCKLFHFTFGLENSKYCIYGIVDEVIDPISNVMSSATKNEESKVSETKHKQPVGLTLVKDIDENSHFPIVYFDVEGKLLKHNANLLNFITKDQLNQKVDDLFLETDFGTLLQTIQKLPEKNCEYLIRIIMKATSGFTDGYGRLTSNYDINKAKIYRMEFSPLDAINMIGPPIAKPSAEIEKLISELEVSKVIVIDNQINDFSFDEIVTRSPRYKAVLRQLAQVADTDTTVLITGETGTGKELLCNALYKLSDRSDEVIVKVNCAAIPENLFESILFGHEKGAFTGADSKKIGKFEMANNGTIFLDEIGEMPLELQSKMLRVLQEGEVERLGNANPIPVNVRVIAATNRNLEKMVKEGRFREDLFYRLSVFPIFNLPLRDRKEDIPILVEHFIKKSNKKTGRNIKKIKPTDLSILKSYDYPGNVRELENIIERSVILSNGEFLEVQLVKDISKTVDSSTENGLFLSFDEMQINHIAKAIKASNGKITGSNSASELLQMNGKTLASKINKFKIDINSIIN